MNPEIKDRWVAALRGGEYIQGRGCLRNLLDAQTGHHTHCCLGVLIDILDGAVIDGGLVQFTEGSYATYDGGEQSASKLPSGLAHALGLPTSDPMICVSEQDRATLAGLNDSGRTFSQIADFIEVQL